MMNLLSGGFLAGYRTYILGAMMALQALASFAVGDIALVEFVNQLPEIFMGLGLMSLRAAVPS